MPVSLPGPEAVVAFWRAAGFDRWFAKSDVFDALTRLRLGAAHEAAAVGALDHWAATPTGATALLILLDQAPRNLFRDSSRAFATDHRAVEIAVAAIAHGHDLRVAPTMRAFFYLPFEHAEDMRLQRECVRLFARLGDENSLRYAELHAEIIARFGRFPHRNPVLGRVSTEDEARYLADGGFSG